MTSRKPKLEFGGDRVYYMPLLHDSPAFEPPQDLLERAGRVVHYRKEVRP
jgi:hypothetical protein